MDISRNELAAIKRVNKNSKVVYNKMLKLKDRISALVDEYNTQESELKAIEAYVISKYGFLSEQILSGEADRIIAEREQESAMENPSVGVEELESEVFEDSYPDYEVSNTEVTEESSDPFTEEI